MSTFAKGWRLHADIGPEWLFLVLGHDASDHDPLPPFTETAWDLSRHHALIQIVVELEGDVILTSHLIGQLVLLHRRVHHAGGSLRICGFSSKNFEVLQLMQLQDRFHNYRSREAAVMGYRDAP